MLSENNISGADEIVISLLKKVKILYYSQTFLPSSLNLSVFLAWKNENICKNVSILCLWMLFSDKVIEIKGLGFVFNQLELILFFT